MDLENKTWTVKVQELEGTDDFFIEIPDEIVKLAGFNPGDTIEWIPNEDGTYTLISENLS